MFNAADLQAIVPEMLLLVLALLLLGIDLLLREERKYLLGVYTAVGMGVILAVALLMPQTGITPAFGGMLIDEPLVRVFRAIFLIAGGLMALLSIDFRPLRQTGVYYAMLALTILGMNLLAGVNDLLLLYLALEMTGITLYILAGYLRNSAFSIEAGLKYLIFGAVTSAIMLYGISWLFGVTGSTRLNTVVNGLLADQMLGHGYFAMVTVVLLLVGVGFKVAVVPLHFWAPDVYEGAPTPVTAFISVASKAAGFVVLLRLVHWLWVPNPYLSGLLNIGYPLMLPTQYGGEATSLAPLPIQVPQLIAILSAVTMTAGNILALTQKNFKRMLAYSSIAQAGYVLIGVAAVSALGISAVAFYLAVYVFTNIAAFGVLILVSNVAGDRISDLAGLNRRSSTLALVLVAALLSLGGVPPFGGFIGKLFLFAAAMEDNRLVWLAIVGALNVILSLYYYLSALRVAYVEPAEDETPIAIPVASRWVLGVACLGILVTGVVGYPLFQAIQQAVALWFPGV